VDLSTINNFVNSNKYKYFLKENIVPSELHNQLLIDVPNFEKSNAFVINKNGTTTHNLTRYNHIRNNFQDDSMFDMLVDDSIVELKNLIKPLLLEQGLIKPVIKGVQNYTNPNSMSWHKDFVPEEMAIDPLKRFISFVILSNDELDHEFMVGSSAESYNTWKLGLHTKLKTNLIIGHNQNLGHEYIKKGDGNICIFSLLYYDLV